ncbi:MAG: hypothetical protein AAFN51_07770, partial [Pseudomonadota bacterium]
EYIATMLDATDDMMLERLYANAPTGVEFRKLRCTLNTDTPQALGACMTKRFADRFADLIPSLRERYDAPSRAYHNWAHIQALLGHFERVSDAMRRPDAVEIALYYHDVIYVPGSKRNEDDSADAMQAELSGRADTETLEIADLIIRATANHAVPENASSSVAQDCALFLDMDLAILGAEPTAFDTFDSAIRQEFGVIPDEIFLPRRRDAMQVFLERDRIYLTSQFHDEFDARARKNLRRLIERLS